MSLKRRESIAAVDAIYSDYEDLAKRMDQILYRVGQGDDANALEDIRTVIETAAERLEEQNHQWREVCRWVPVSEQPWKEQA